MKVIVLRHWPLSRRIDAISLCGIVLARVPLSPALVRHEHIHLLQQREMLWLPFFVWYVLEWVVRLIQYRSTFQAYRNISFEREAYACQRDTTYPQHRRRYAWVKHL